MLRLTSVSRYLKIVWRRGPNNAADLGIRVRIDIYKYRPGLGVVEPFDIGVAGERYWGHRGLDVFLHGVASFVVLRQA